MFAGDGDYGNAGQAEGCCVAEKTAAGLAVVCAGGEDGHGRGGKQEEVVLGEEGVDAFAESCVALAKGRDFTGRDAGSPFEALADG